MKKHSFEDDLREIGKRFKQAKKAKRFEEAAYYGELSKGGWSAAASWEQFKGSGAYEFWMKKRTTIEMIQSLEQDSKRFSWMN